MPRTKLTLVLHAHTKDETSLPGSYCIDKKRIFMVPFIHKE
jgi:hypothetical protein